MLTLLDFSERGVGTRLESPLVVQEPVNPRLAKGQSPATSRLTFPSVLYLEWIATSVSSSQSEGAQVHVVLNV